MAGTPIANVGVGDILTATGFNAILAMLNAELQTPYTPTFASGFTLGAGTLSAVYTQNGDTVAGRIVILAGSGTTWTSGSIAPTVPVGAIGGNTTDATQVVGWASYYDLSAGSRFTADLVNLTTNTAMQPRGRATVSSSTSAWSGNSTAGSVVPTGAAIATGDVITFTFQYEVA